MKQLPLAAAVAVTVQAFTTAQKEFSAHDVTRELRTLVNSGELGIIDLSRVDVDGIPNTYRIDHNTVRGYVRASFGSVPNYERDNSRGYALYRPKTAGSSYSATPVATPAPTTYTSQVSAPPFSTAITSKVISYVNNKLADGICPTLKQIQSRLKGYSITCKEIADILPTALYKVAVNSDVFSRSTVSR